MSVRGADCIAETDTAAHAHVKLPAAGWGEKDGAVTNSESVISRQPSFLPLPREAKPDWWIVKEVGRRMGWTSDFAYSRPADIYREHARHSGQPGFKSPPARAKRIGVEWRGFLIARDEPGAIDVIWATRVRVPQGWLIELAGDGDPAKLIRQLLPRGAHVETSDPARGQERHAVIVEGKLAAALYLSRTRSLPPRDWLIAQLAAAEAPPTLELLAGSPTVPHPDHGPIVCACFDVGMKTILDAIGRLGLTSVEAVGGARSAGTNCGSCRPAIQRLIVESKESAHG